MTQKNDAQRARKPRNTKGTILRLMQTMMHDYALFILALALTLVGNLLALVGPSLAGEAIDAIGAPGGIAWEIIRKCVLMLICYALSAVLTYLLSLLMIHISRGVVYRMREQAFDRLMRMPVGYYDRHPSGDIISRISYDVDTVNTSLSNDIVQILSTIVTVVGSLGFMIAISPKLLTVFCVTVPLSIYAARRRATVTKPLFRARSHKLGELNSMVEEQLSGLTTLRAYCREDASIEKFDVINEEAVEAYYQSEYEGSVVGPLVNFINNLSLALVSVFGALLFCAGQMTIGSISSFILPFLCDDRLDLLPRLFRQFPGFLFREPGVPRLTVLVLPRMIRLRKQIPRTQSLFVFGQFLTFLFAALVDFGFAFLRISLCADAGTEPTPVTLILARLCSCILIVICLIRHIRLFLR